MPATIALQSAGALGHVRMPALIMDATATNHRMFGVPLALPPHVPQFAEMQHMGALHERVRVQIFHTSNSLADAKVCERDQVRLWQRAC